MHRPFRRLSGFLLCVALLGLLGGCKSAEQTDEVSSSSASPRSTVGPTLARSAKTVRTIQLYKGSDERNLPVLSLESGTSLTLEFDLMTRQGRPLSIYFQHADRTWKRDLTDSQILESFQDDRLVEYQISQGTTVPYVHYVYRFPNDDIRFRVSGNYVLRVTERGRRDSVLFERAFFITEKAGKLNTGAESLLVPGQQRPSIQPNAKYTPPSEIRGDPFSYSVCFVRNGRLPATRCQDQPQLVSQPKLEFELPRDRAFAPTTAARDLDLSTLRSTNQIARIDRTTAPIEALLSPDYARFAENRLGPEVESQIVVRDALSDLINPALSAEYVQTTFAFVPGNETPYGSELVVSGSFNGLDPDRGTTMKWIEERGRYEGTVLLKQGRYQYFYSTSDPTFAKQMRRSQRRITGSYAAFVYYRDAQRGTDRLLQVGRFAP